MICARDASQDLAKQTIIEKCTDLDNCDLGFEYKHKNRKECCGKCEPVACNDNGTLKNIGDTWYSHDWCIKKTCKSSNGSVKNYCFFKTYF